MLHININWWLMELPYWFKVIFAQHFGKFIACNTHNIILHEMRFNPHEVRLNIRKLKKFGKLRKLEF